MWLKCIYNDNGDVLDDGTQPPCDYASVWTSQTVTVYGYPRIPYFAQQAISQIGSNTLFMESGWFYAGWFGAGVLAAPLFVPGLYTTVGQTVGATIETYASGAIQATTDFISGLDSAGAGGSTCFYAVSRASTLTLGSGAAAGSWIERPVASWLMVSGRPSARTRPRSTRGNPAIWSAPLCGQS